MKDFWTKILASLVSAAIIGNTVLLLDVRDRLTRLETSQNLKNVVVQTK